MKIKGFSLFLFPLVLLFSCHKIEVKSYIYQHPLIPEEFNGYSLVLLTDIHMRVLKKESEERRIKYIAQVVAKLKPDLLLYGGDYIYGGYRDKESDDKIVSSYELIA